MFLNGERGPALEQRENPWMRVSFPRVLQRRIKNGDINGIFISYEYL
jgi:hypothetical protein